MIKWGLSGDLDRALTLDSLKRELLTGNGFPVTAYIDGFSVSGTGYIPAILLCHFKPVIRAFSAKFSLDNEKASK